MAHCKRTVNYNTPIDIGQVLLYNKTLKRPENINLQKMEHLIEIDDGSRIKVEDNNYTLQYKRKTENGEIRWDLGGYFPTLEYLLKDWVINSPTRSSRAIRDLKGLVSCIQEAERHVERLLMKESDKHIESSI